MSETPEKAGLTPLKRALLALDDLQGRLGAAERRGREPIAVIGIGCRLPGGVCGPSDFWRLLMQGVNAITPVPADRWDADAVYDPDPEAPGKTYSRWGGFIDRVDGFDPLLFGIAPREAVAMDPQQRLLLEVSWEALEHAGQAPDRLVGTRTGVFVGICSADYQRLSPHNHDPQEIDAYSASGIAHSIASGRVAYVLGLQGPAVSVDTACSSSLVALHLACQSLRAGESRMALAGGVHLMLAPDNTILFSKSRMMSPSGRCSTFGADADGFVLGEGCGVVVLKKLADAQADGDRILAVVRGTAANQDGPSGGLTVPNGPAQESVIREALASAGLQPADVGYVEAHGTGTSLGDPIEVRALGNALGPGRPADRPLLIGSVKTNLGHLEAAAGITGVIKAVLAVHYGEIPPHLHAEKLSPHIPWNELPVQVAGPGARWPEGLRRVAGVSSFGFSGTNAHAVIEEPPKAEPPPVGLERPRHLLALSARTEGALRAQAARYAEHLAADASDALDVAHTANVGRAHLAHRRAVPFRTAGELRERLVALAAGNDPEGVSAGILEGTDRPRVVFLFTGQGAQYAGMGRTLYETQPTFRRALDRCQEGLRAHLDRPLVPLIFEQGALLDHTGYTQPALFSIEFALAELWRSWGVEPAAVLGHSVGEYVAAALAGVFSLEDGLRLIAARGRLMQALPPGGVMVAVQADEARVREAIAPFAGRVDLAAVNAPTGIVISGAADAVEKLVAGLAAEGVKTKPLAVSHAFHSPLMEPMRAEFERVAAAIAFAAPNLPLVSNLTGEAFRAGQAPDAGYWGRHVREPVRFRDSLSWLHRKGYRVFLEIGPAATLSGLGPQCVEDTSCLWLPSLRKGRDDWEAMLSSLGSLYVRGARIDWAGFDRGYARRTLALPTYPFERERYWVPPLKSRGRDRRETQGEHPLLGQRLRSAVISDAVFEQTLSATTPDFIQDHRVHDVVVFPGTGYLEMGLAAGAAVLGRKPALEDVTIREPLVFPTDGGRTVQVTVGRDGDRHTFRVFSQDTADADTWRLLAEGRLISSPPAAASAPSVREAEGRCSQKRDGPAFYASLSRRGLDFGERFRSVTAIAGGQNEALAHIAAPESLGRSAALYGLHPALLDGCVQALAAAFPDEAGAPVFMPIGIASVAMFAEPGSHLVSHARVERPTSSETARGEVTVYREEDGVLVARLSGIALKRADPDALARAVAGGTAASGWLYEVAWEHRPLGGGSSGTPRVPLVPLAASLEPRFPVLSREHGFAVFAEAEPLIDAACADYTAQALQSMGWNWEEGAREPEQGLLARLGIAERHGRAFQRLLEMLVEQGRLRLRAGQWEPTGQGGRGLSCTELLARYPGFRAEIGLVQRCGERLADLLRAKLDPLHLLFPDGSTEAAEQLYVHSPGAKAYNSLACEILQALTSTAGPLRILEIGGGTGGTTAYLLPQLDKERTEYLFTDVSPLFAAKAEERFRSFPFVRTQALDIERDPEAQGLEASRFDVIVAANVLHATADLRRTLRHVRKLLAPGGVLILIEVTRPQGWIDLSFGLTEGWWLFTDTDLRTSYPLLGREAWTRFLRDGAGFAEAVSIPAAEAGTREPVQAIVVARAPAVDTTRTSTTTDKPATEWLLLADAGGVGDRLAAGLAAAGGPVVRVRRTGSFAATADGYTLDENSAADWRRLFAATGPVRNVVHLWGLDVTAAARTTVDTLREDERAACGTAVQLLQAITALASTAPPQLFLVTRGAQPAADVVTAPAQAALWGLGKVIDLEHPELRCTRIDLAPAGQAGEIDALVAELRGNDGEDQVALRSEGRLVPRLAPRGLRGPAAPAAPWELGIGTRGVLDNLELRKAPRRVPGRGEVEVEVHAVGLNFRDVLSAMGLYPGEAPPFGSECAGRIVAVGEDVLGLAVGEDVIAIAPGSFRSHLVASADFVVRKPASVSYAEAATLGVPFVTAWFCLRHVASLRSGERVLIHAAAGGVGLAAVQIAQLVGAEVFATAGSPEKREFLAALGVRHIMDSRSLSFAGEVHAATGGQGVDVVLNSLAGAFVGASLGATAKGGRFVEIGKREIWEPERVKAERPDLGYTVVDWGETAREDPALIRGMLEEVIGLVREGVLFPLPRRLFPASEAVAAFRYMAQGRHLGKIVLTMRPAASHEVAIRDDRTYLVTGGLGGLGLLTAEWLVEQGARHLALLGRREPQPDARAVLERMGAGGVQVKIFQADVTEAPRMKAVLGQIASELPPLGGIVHSAGMLDDGVLTQLDWPRFARVLGPKLDGAWILHSATLEQPLDFFVLYSSVASLFGSPGQANHAAANAFLDALAHHRRACGLPAVSLNWGAWEDVGAAAERKAGGRAAEQGIGGIPPREGLALLARLLAPSAAQVGVAAVDWPKLLARYPAGRVPRFLRSAGRAAIPNRVAAAPAPAELRRQLDEASAGSREHLLRTDVREAARKVLGLETAEDIDPKRPLQELGLDSLMAVELRNALGRALGSTLPATLLFDHPTVNAIVAFVGGEVLGWGQPTSAGPAAAPPSTGDVLASVEDLSDEEVARLLSEKMGGGP